MAVVNNVILHPTKRRDKRMRALHLCEVGELAGRGPDRTRRKPMQTRLTLQCRFVWQQCTM